MREGEGSKRGEEDGHKSSQNRPFEMEDAE